MQRWHGMSAGRFVFVAIASIALGLSMAAPQTAAQDDVNELTILLNEFEDSGVSGWAMLTAQEEGVTVQMAVEGDQVTGDHPTHIHTGTCEDFDPNPTFPLETVILDPLSADGVSQSNVTDVTLAELLASDYVVLVHKSMEELTNYFVCGNINQANAIPAPPAGSAGSVGLAETGTGSALDAESASGWILRGSAVVALALAAIALQMRRRSFAR
jgi:hypothetical protein